jgi:hypothetical protein
MSNTIQIKRSSTSGSAPTAGQLAQGELAVNLADEALYTKDVSNAVVKLNAPSIDDKNTGATKHVTIASGGNVGIGTSSPSGRLHVSGSSVDIWLTDTAGTANTWRILAKDGTTTAALRFYDQTNVAERMRIDSSGNLLVGTTTGAVLGNERLSVDGGSLGVKSANATTAGIWNTNATGTYVSFFVSGSTNTGNITTNGTGTTYATSSDYRLKHDIQPMQNALATVAQLKPVTYKWNADDSQSQGFIAHELAEVVPECVTGEKDAVDAEGNPQYQGIDTSFLVATLTAAIQEQQAIITALTARVEALEAV